MFLDIQDKLYGFAFTNEYEYNEDKMKKDLESIKNKDVSNLSYYPSSYFTQE